jgi:hypothetical protein
MDVIEQLAHYFQITSNPTRTNTKGLGQRMELNSRSELNKETALKGIFIALKSVLQI